MLWACVLAPEDVSPMVAGGCARWRSKQDSNLHYLADRLGFQPRRIPITSLLHIESCSTTVMRNMADAPIHDVFSCFFALQLWRRERVSNPQTAHHDCQFSKLGGIAAFHSRHIKARLGRHLSAPSMEGYVPSLHRHLRLAKKILHQTCASFALYLPASLPIRTQ